MNIVLLPGMDGTGCLFTPLLKQLNEYNCEVITLPQSGSQNYSTLAKYVIDRLPTEDYIVIAESFSGPIAAQLAQLELQNLKGIIFVATFLSSPNKYLLKLVKQLPIHLLNKLPTAKYFIKKLFLGVKSDKVLVLQFLDTVNRVPAKVLKDRIQTMQSLKFQAFDCNLPAVYILPDSDKLVPANKAYEFKSCFKNLVIKTIKGPHFIIQSEPEKSADIIIDHIQSFSQSGVKYIS